MVKSLNLVTEKRTFLYHFSEMSFQLTFKLSFLMT